VKILKTKKTKKKGFALVGIAIGVAVAAIVVGVVAIPLLATVNTSGWASADVTIFNTVKTFLLLSLLLGAIAGTGLYAASR